MRAKSLSPSSIRRALLQVPRMSVLLAEAGDDDADRGLARLRLPTEPLSYSFRWNIPKEGHQIGIEKRA